MELEDLPTHASASLERRVTVGNRIWSGVLLAVVILILIGIVTFVLWILFISDPPPSHVEESYSSSVVELRASSESDVIHFVQPVTFYRGASFGSFDGINITANNATFGVLILTNQTSGATYNVDSIIELLVTDMSILFETLGLPVDLVDFLTSYAGVAKRKRDSHSTTPTLPAFLGDALNNITTLQGLVVCENSTLNANANYAFYPSTGGNISVSPLASLVPLLTSGPTVLQTGVVMGINSFSFTKAGLYRVSYNIGINQPAAANTVQVNLQVAATVINTSYMNWDGLSTGITYVSGEVIAMLNTGDYVQLSVTSTVSGATIDAVSTQLMGWNIA